MRRALIRLQKSSHSRAMVGVKHRGNKQLPPRENSRAKTSATAPRLSARILLRLFRFSLICLLTQIYASARERIPMSSARLGRRACGEIENSRVPVGKARYLSASVKSALISRPLENTVALIAFATQDKRSWFRGLSCNSLTNCEIKREGSIDAIFRLRIIEKCCTSPLPTRCNMQRLRTTRRYFANIT